MQRATTPVPACDRRAPPPTTDGRSPFGISRRAERQRLERDQFEHGADQQPLRRVARRARPRASPRPADARSSPAGSSRRRGRRARRAATIGTRSTSASRRALARRAPPRAARARRRDVLRRDGHAARRDGAQRLLLVRRQEHVAQALGTRPVAMMDAADVHGGTASPRRRRARRIVSTSPVSRMPGRGSPVARPVAARRRLDRDGRRPPSPGGTPIR